MALIEWRDEYRTGIDSVDFEHQALIELIDCAYEMIKNQDDKNPVVDSLGDIYGSISAHFALEEQMMIRHDYDRYAEHKADHDSLLNDIRDITEEFERSVKLDKPAFEKKLAEWFELHFKTHDSRLHSLSGMHEHEPASLSSRKNLIQHAKDRLLQQMEQYVG